MSTLFDGHIEMNFSIVVRIIVQAVHLLQMAIIKREIAMRQSWCWIKCQRWWSRWHDYRPRGLVWVVDLDCRQHMRRYPIEGVTLWGVWDFVQMQNPRQLSFLNFWPTRWQYWIAGKRQGQRDFVKMIQLKDQRLKGCPIRVKLLPD